MNSASAASAPTGPRNFAPMHTVMLTTFGPGMNWQKLSRSAKSRSLSQRRSSTMMRRTQTIGPPNPYIDVLRNAINSAPSVTGGVAPGDSLSAPGGGEGWGEVGDSIGVGPTSPFPLLHNGSPPSPPFRAERAIFAAPIVQWLSSAKRLLERGPHGALRVYRVVDRRHH